jgi:Leucine Rich Repeat (LRR) protein
MRGARSGVVLAGFLTAFAAIAGADYYMQVKAFLHTPEVFADRSLGAIPTDLRIPVAGVTYQSLWYVQYVGHLSFANLPELLRLVQAREIPGVDLSGQRDISDPDMDSMSKVQLRFLNLAGTGVSDRGLGNLFALRDSLKVLLLNAAITDEGLASMTRFGRLIELGLADSHVTDKGMEVLKGFERLQRLDLGGTVVTDKGLAALAELPLAQLRLGPRVTDAGMAALRSITTLEQIDLAQTAVTEAGLQYLSGKPRLHTLFAGPKMTDQGVATLAAMRSLRRLDLSHAAITDGAVKSLARLKGLEELALSQTRVSDAAVASLLTLPHLRYLEISDTRVSLEGLRRLAGLKSLQVLSFSTTGKVTLGDVKPLGKLPALQALIINGFPLPSEAMEYIRGRGPKPKENAGLWRVLVPDAEAAERPLSDAVDVAVLTHTAEAAAVSGEAYTGLKRIHHVESELDEVIPAPSTMNVDNEQDTQKNFLGEFSAGVQRKPKPKSSE